jgi:prepilin-type N-terminal cleavage/methylation domain-containing protein
MVTSNRCRRTSARHGFTLVEVMVVTLIAAVLASLIVSAIMRALNTQQRRNTETELLKVSDGFKSQWRATLDGARTEQINPIAAFLAKNPLSPQGEDARARVIHNLMVLRREFPTNFAEATQSIGIPPSLVPLAGSYTFGPSPDYGKILTPQVIALNLTSQLRTPADESSTCLYLALKKRRRGVDFDPDTSLSTQELVDPLFGPLVGSTKTSDGTKEIMDNWGRPLVFYRWPSPQPPQTFVGLYDATLPPPQISPIGYPRPYTNSASPPDNQDPEGALLNAAWQKWISTPQLWAQQPPQGYGLNQQQQADMQALVASVFWWQGQTWQSQNYNAQNPLSQLTAYPLAPAVQNVPQQYNLTPVIMSLGSDGLLWNATVSPPMPKDDIYNFQLGLGGQR